MHTITTEALKSPISTEWAGPHGYIGTCVGLRKQICIFICTVTYGNVPLIGVPIVYLAGKPSRKVLLYSCGALPPGLCAGGRGDSQASLHIAGLPLPKSSTRPAGRLLALGGRWSRQGRLGRPGWPWRPVVLVQRLLRRYIERVRSLFLCGCPNWTKKSLSYSLRWIHQPYICKERACSILQANVAETRRHMRQATTHIHNQYLHILAGSQLFMLWPWAGDFYHWGLLHSLSSLLTITIQRHAIYKSNGILYEA